MRSVMPTGAHKLSDHLMLPIQSLQFARPVWAAMWSTGRPSQRSNCASADGAVSHVGAEPERAGSEALDGTLTHATSGKMAASLPLNAQSLVFSSPLHECRGMFAAIGSERHAERRLETIARPWMFILNSGLLHCEM